jgi:hypothetical protein
MGIADSDNQFPKLLLVNDGDDTTPDTGLAKLYVDASKVLHYVDDVGADVDLSSGGAATTQILAVQQYIRGTDGALITSSSTSMVDVDATNAAVTFTAPASGNVKVTCEGFGASDAGNYLKIGLRESTSNIAGPALVVNASASGGRFSVTFWLTGVSAGSHTYKMSMGMSSAANGSVLGGPNFGSVLLVVEAG